VAADILAERIQKTYGRRRRRRGADHLIGHHRRARSTNQGFRDQIAAKYGALDIVAEKSADGRATAREIMIELINAHPELRGVVASNLLLTQGAAEVLTEHKTNQTGDTINLVGFDWNDQLVKSCRKARLEHSLYRTHSAWVTRVSRRRSRPRRAKRYPPPLIPV